MTDIMRPPPARKPAALAAWRLKRAIGYVEAHLAGPVRLADIAATTGLSAMHFAAQFRAATGFRPREYLLRRRIARAQHLLATSSAPLFDVALDVGFQTQAHFTTVFKRVTGDTPARWRARNYAGAELLLSSRRRGASPGAAASSPQPAAPAL